MNKTNIASRLRPPMIRSATSTAKKLPVLKENSTNITIPTVTFNKPGPGAASSSSTSNVLASSHAIRRGRRSKSFGVSTAKASMHNKIKSSALTSTLAKKPLAGRVAATNVTSRLNTGLTRTATLAAASKTAVKRPAATTAETTKAVPSAPKLSKFDFKGRLAALEDKHKVLVTTHKEAKSRLEILEDGNIFY